MKLSNMHINNAYLTSHKVYLALYWLQNVFIWLHYSCCYRRNGESLIQSLRVYIFRKYSMDITLLSHPHPNPYICTPSRGLMAYIVRRHFVTICRKYERLFICGDMCSYGLAHIWIDRAIINIEIARFKSNLRIRHTDKTANYIQLRIQQRIHVHRMDGFLHRNDKLVRN